MDLDLLSYLLRALGDEQLILVFASHCAPARGLRERALETFLIMFLETFVKSARSVIFVVVEIMF